MEGVTQEAASLAGHLQLGKLIYLYDQNHISLAGATDIDFTEDVARRFEAYGWHTRTVPDGNDTEDVAEAIEEAQAETAAPVADPGPHAHRLRQPAEAGQLLRARQSARRRRTAGHQEGAGLADHGQVLPCRKTPSIISAQAVGPRRSARTSGRRSSTHIGRTSPRKPPNSRCW